MAADGGGPGHVAAWYTSGVYYDRRVPPELLDLLLPDGALGWLLPWLRTPAASAAGAHVQTRRARSGSRQRGGVQLYVGRTSPFEVRGRARGRVKLFADRFYVGMTPSLFARDLDVDVLAALAPVLRDHVERAALETHRSFVDGEAVAHAGMMRRYGPLAAEDAPFVALDSEARMGFASRAEQQAFEGALRARVGLPDAEAVPQKLDLVAVDAAGRLLVVEVKAEGGSLTRAAWQAAVHVARFEALVAEQPGWFGEVLGEVARDKARVGLLGGARVPVIGGAPELVPVIAAPDGRGGWAEAWRRQVAPVVEASGALGGLRLWRLAADGQVLEDVAA